MKKWFLVILLLTLPLTAWPATLSWDAVGNYSDGTAIEPTKAVLYNVERNGAVVSAKQAAVSFAFATGHSVTETFRVQTELSTGEVSDWTPPFSWISAAGVPNPPSNLTIR